MKGEQRTARSPSILPEHMRSPTWYGEQDENGVDLSLIRENLKLTPLERVRRGDRARRDALRVSELGRSLREQEVRGH